MFAGNPHQDQRGRKAFTTGWQDGWNDLKNDNIRDWQGPMNPPNPMNPGGTRIVPSNGIGPFPKRESGSIPFNQTASYSTQDRVYDDFIIQDYLNQGIIMPDEVFDTGQDGYKQVRPKLMGQELQGPLYFG